MSSLDVVEGVKLIDVVCEVMEICEEVVNIENRAV